MLALVGLAEAARKRTKGFSLGMGQRLGIAAALLGNPQILMFDEPTNGLDPEGILWIRNLMRALAAEGRTVIVSSHLMSEMENIADHVLVIGRGRLIADCTVDEFIAAGSAAQRPGAHAAAGGAEQAGRGGRRHGQSRRRGRGRGVRSGDRQDWDLAFENAVRLDELAPVHASLEQAFMELTAASVQFHAGAPDQRVPPERDF